MLRLLGSMLIAISATLALVMAVALVFQPVVYSTGIYGGRTRLLALAAEGDRVVVAVISSFTTAASSPPARREGYRLSIAVELPAKIRFLPPAPGQRGVDVAGARVIPVDSAVASQLESEAPQNPVVSPATLRALLSDAERLYGSTPLTRGRYVFTAELERWVQDLVLVVEFRLSDIANVSVYAPSAKKPVRIVDIIEGASRGCTRCAADLRIILENSLRSPSIRIVYRASPTPWQFSRAAALALIGLALLIIDYRRDPEAYQGLVRLFHRLRSPFRRGGSA